MSVGCVLNENIFTKIKPCFGINGSSARILSAIVLSAYLHTSMLASWEEFRRKIKGYLLTLHHSLSCKRAKNKKSRSLQRTFKSRHSACVARSCLTAEV